MNFYTGATCRSCGAPIVWTRTEAGKAMPVDREPAVNGNLFIDAKGHSWGDSRPQAHSRVVAADEEPERARYLSHFVTCPNSKQHRSRS